MTLHDWSRRAPRHLSGQWICTLCRAVSSVTRPRHFGKALTAADFRRRLLVALGGSWKDVADCPDTCEETRELALALEVQGS